MSELALQLSVLNHESLSKELLQQARVCAHAWIAECIDPSTLEIFGEYLARIAESLAEQELAFEVLVKNADWLGTAPQVIAYLQTAWREPLNAERLAVLSIHLLDIAEFMALEIFVPEISNLSARSDRSATSARSTGVARRLRG